MIGHRFLKTLSALHHLNFVSFESIVTCTDFNENQSKEFKKMIKIIAEGHSTLNFYIFYYEK